MKRTTLMLGMTLLVGIYLGVIGAQILHAQPEPIKPTVLLKTHLVGMEGKEAILALAEIAPGAATAPPCTQRPTPPRSGRSSQTGPATRRWHRAPTARCR